MCVHRADEFLAIFTELEGAQPQVVETKGAAVSS
jgi:hypothetical protein